MITLQNIEVSEAEEITEPVSLDEAKAWAMVDHDDHNDLLTSMITGAREDIEQELNIKLVPATVSFHVTTTKEGEQVGQFPWVMSLSHVSDLEVSRVEDGEENEVLTADDDYYFNGTLKIGSYGRSLVSFTLTPVVPQALKEAIMMLVTYRYENRGSQKDQHGLPADIERKIAKYRQVWL